MTVNKTRNTSAMIFGFILEGKYMNQSCWVLLQFCKFVCAFLDNTKKIVLISKFLYFIFA